MLIFHMHALSFINLTPKLILSFSTSVGPPILVKIAHEEIETILEIVWSIL